MRADRSLVLLAVLSLPVFAAAPRELSIPDALRLAEQTNPDLKAALQREHVSEGTINILKSFYYPTFDAQAIDSLAFPAPAVISGSAA